LVPRSRGAAQAILPRKSNGKDAHPLTILEANFVIEYIKDFNQREAAIRAGYSPKSINNTASEVMNRPHVLAEIKDQLHSRAVRNKTTTDKVFRWIADLAMVDIRSMFKKDGTLVALTDMSKEQAFLIQGMDVQETFDKEGKYTGRIKKVRLINRLDTLRTLAKHLGMLDERLRVDGKMEHEHNHYHHIQVDMTDLTEKELEMLFNMSRKVKVIDVTPEESNPNKRLPITPGMKAPSRRMKKHG